jgi:CheY-like chemotaxis protein
MACDYRPDCLLLDLVMPRMDGYTLARKLRAQAGLEHVKLVALTAHVAEPFVRLAWDAGFDHYYAKPTDLASVHGLRELLRAMATAAVSVQEAQAEQMVPATEN